MLNKQNIIALFSRIKDAVWPSHTHEFAGEAASMNPEYLHSKHFAHVMIAAIALHAVALFIWHLSPKTEVVDIPVRALNIKLGEIDMSEAQIQAVEPTSANSKAVENTLSKLVEGVKLRDDAIKPVEASEKSIKQKTAKKVAPVEKKKVVAKPKQFIRSSNTAAPSHKVVSGNSTATDAQIMRRYEQVISLWIKKFKLYPDEARAQGMEGETVVRIRIDRRGNVKYSALERSTGYQTLDHAAIAMIKRANPVPAVPHDYPPGDQMEFLIPVNFHLK